MFQSFSNFTLLLSLVNYICDRAPSLGCRSGIQAGRGQSSSPRQPAPPLRLTKWLGGKHEMLVPLPAHGLWRTALTEAKTKPPAWPRDTSNVPSRPKLSCQAKPECQCFLSSQRVRIEIERIQHWVWKTAMSPCGEWGIEPDACIGLHCRAALRVKMGWRIKEATKRLLSHQRTELRCSSKWLPNLQVVSSVWRRYWFRFITATCMYSEKLYFEVMQFSSVSYVSRDIGVPF